jgi:heme-degrading monooxygenase HmoA
MTKPTGAFMVLNIWDTEQQANAWPQNPRHQQVATQLKLFILNHAIDKLKDKVYILNN